MAHGTWPILSTCLLTLQCPVAFCLSGHIELNPVAVTMAVPGCKMCRKDWESENPVKVGRYSQFDTLPRRGRNAVCTICENVSRARVVGSKAGYLEKLQSDEAVFTSHMQGDDYFVINLNMLSISRSL